VHNYMLGNHIDGAALVGINTDLDLRLYIVCEYSFQIRLLSP
jgi:hypothetical protein